MELVTTLHSRRLEKIHEGEVHPALAPVLRDARHARDPADDPAQERSRPPQGPGAGLADTYPDERAYGAPAPTTEARLWPCGSRRGSADPAGGEARGDQLRLVHQDKSLPRDQGERPLSYSVWEGAQAYVRRVRSERKHEQDVRERPMQFRVVPGQGPVVDWRRGSPS